MYGMFVFWFDIWVHDCHTYILGMWTKNVPYLKPILQNDKILVILLINYLLIRKKYIFFVSVSSNYINFIFTT